MTSTSTVNGDTFKANFVNYYSKKQILISAISDKAKESGDTAQSNLNEGRLVINQNTTFNGDANFVSNGDNEYIQINGGSIDFYRDDVRLTNLKNIRFGSVVTDAFGSGTVSFTGFKQPMLILPTIRKADFDKNIASFFCYTELIDSVNNTYKFYLGATSEYHLPSTNVTQEGKSLSFDNALETTLIGFTGKLDGVNKIPSWDSSKTESGKYNYTRYFNYTINKRPSFKIILKRIDEENGTQTLYENIFYPSVSVSHNFINSGLTSVTATMKMVDFSKTLNILTKYTSRNTVQYIISTEILESEFRISMNAEYTSWNESGSGGANYFHKWLSSSNQLVYKITNDMLHEFSITASAETSTITDAFGNGTVNYIAMEIE